MKTNIDTSVNIPVASAIPFELAEQIVRDRMTALYNELKKSNPSADPFIALNYCGYKTPSWAVYENGVLEAHGTGETLATAIANMPNPYTSKLEKIKELESEISKLKSEIAAPSLRIRFNENDCGGVFDGVGVVSDADPGM